VDRKAYNNLCDLRSGELKSLCFSHLYSLKVSTINFQQLSLEFQQLSRGLTAGKGNKLAVRDGEGAANKF